MDRLSSAYAALPLLFWVLGSLLAYSLITNAHLLTRSKAFWRSPYSRWLLQAGRFLYFLGIPYLVLGGWPRQPYQGLLSTEDLGLVGLNERWPVTRWLEATSTGLGLGLIALLVLALAWTNANRSADGTRLRFSHRPRWATLVGVLYLEVHWAFYRGALAVELGDVYAGVFVALGAVYLEWSLNPFWRAGWRREPQAAERWLHTAMALVMALLFLLTRNLWVCLGVHGLLELSLRQLGRDRLRHTDADGPRSLPESASPGENPSILPIRCSSSKMDCVS